MNRYIASILIDNCHVVDKNKLISLTTIVKKKKVIDTSLHSR